MDDHQRGDNSINVSRAAAAIGWALTGQEFSDGPDSLDPDVLVAWLCDRGWDRLSVERRRDVARRSGEHWPGVVTAGHRGGLGAAQYQAVLRQVLLALGLDHAAAVLRDAATPQDAGDRRLMAELPPHFGRVG